MDIPVGRQFFGWHLYALHYGKSLSWEHRDFLPLLFGGSHQQEICVLLGPRQEPDMKLEAKAAPKGEDELNIKRWTPIQPYPICYGKSMHSNLPALPFMVAQGVFYPALQ